MHLSGCDSFPPSKSVHQIQAFQDSVAVSAERHPPPPSPSPPRPVRLPLARAGLPVHQAPLGPPETQLHTLSASVCFCASSEQHCLFTDGGQAPCSWGHSRLWLQWLHKSAWGGPRGTTRSELPRGLHPRPTMGSWRVTWELAVSVWAQVSTCTSLSGPPSTLSVCVQRHSTGVLVRGSLVGERVQGSLWFPFLCSL